MARIQEWIKGITFFMFVTVMFYFLWENIFSNIIDFVGSDVFNIGSEADTSVAILKGVVWVSFVFLYLCIGGIYLIFSIIAGSKNNIKTQPLEFLKAVGIWSLIMPFATFIYGLIHFLTTSLNDSNIIDGTMQTTANQFSWIIGIIILLALTIFPFIFIIKGYGIDIFGDKGGSNE